MYEYIPKNAVQTRLLTIPFERNKNKESYSLLVCLPLRSQLLLWLVTVYTVLLAELEGQRNSRTCMWYSWSSVIPVFLLRISSVTSVYSQNPFRTRFVAPVALDASSSVYSVAFFPHHSLRSSHVFLAVLIVPFESSDISNTSATIGRWIDLLVIRGWGWGDNWFSIAWRWFFVITVIARAETGGRHLPGVANLVPYPIDLVTDARIDSRIFGTSRTVWDNPYLDMDVVGAFL